MAELYGPWFASMFTTDSDFQLGTNTPTGGHSKPNQLPNSIPIKYLELIVGKYTTFYVIG